MWAHRAWLRKLPFYTAILVRHKPALLLLLLNKKPGSDSIVHISEEVNNASLTVPRVMWWSYLMNAALGFVALLTMLFCIGPLETAVEEETPYLKLFLNTGSQPLAYVLLIILFLLIFSGNITCLATASREVFAFSRDRGFPFSRWLSRMDKKRHIPFNSVYVTSIVSGIICLINLGSTVGFNIVVSLNLLALMSTYMLSIGCIALKRLRGEPLPSARWSLGRWGLAVNSIGFVYSGFVVVFSCFPNGIPVDTSTANWAPLVWVAVAMISAVTYVLHGKRHFTAPVVFIEGKRLGSAPQTTE
jgi:choline transport protein